MNAKLPKGGEKDEERYEVLQSWDSIFKLFMPWES